MKYQQDNTIITLAPDIMIDYDSNLEKKLPVCVIYLRPDTNILSYEHALLKGIEQYAKVIYMANLNGGIFIKNALILDHYAYEYKYSIYAKQEIAKFPEMISEFENHFKEKFEKARIIGAFESLILLGLSPQKLFDYIVEEKDFLKFYGNTIKKIRGFYIINYNIPALIEKYDTKTNIFILAIQFKSDKYSFKEINDSIIDNIKNDRHTPIIDEKKFKKNMDLCEKVKRTYHISTSHIKSMFDMTDFIFKRDGSQITFSETPMGKLLIENNIPEFKIKQIKDYPIVYINENNKKKLINLPDESIGKSIDDSIDLVKSIF